MPDTILVIAPHMDDEVLGCGGAIAKHLAAQDAVHVVIVANRAYGHRYDEALIEREKQACRAAGRVLGYGEPVFLDLPDERLDNAVIDVAVPLEEAAASVRPDVVYIPHRGDNNQDHRAVFDAARIALRPFTDFAPRTLLCYEVPSSTDISPPGTDWPFAPSRYVDITGHLDAKLDAMDCYQAESRSFPHPRSRKALETHARSRGVQVGADAAEAFMVLRDIWR